jgi:osmotically inducible protein OsmC
VVDTVTRSARSVWRGGLEGGEGRLLREEVGREERVSWAARTGRHRHDTSPEELIAAAHAGCFSMALANVLAEDGHPPAELDVRASCAFDPAALRITTVELAVTGRVAGLDEDGFADAVRRAERGCPVSNALRGNVAIRVSPRFVG